MFHSRRNYDRPRFHVRETNWSPEGKNEREKSRVLESVRTNRGDRSGSAVASNDAVKCAKSGAFRSRGAASALQQNLGSNGFNLPAAGS